MSAVGEMIHNGVPVSLLILAPNDLYLFPGKRTAKKTCNGEIPKALTFLEQTGRITPLAPAGSSPEPGLQASLLFSGLTRLSCMVHLVCWGRWFFRGRDTVWLRRPLWGVPLPMALFPLLLLSLMAWMMAVLLFFVPTHIRISRKTLA